MKVILKNTFFAEGKRYRASTPLTAAGARDVPDHLRSALPKSAKVLGEGGEVPGPKIRVIQHPSKHPLLATYIKEGEEIPQVQVENLDGSEYVPLDRAAAMREAEIRSEAKALDDEAREELAARLEAEAATGRAGKKKG